MDKKLLSVVVSFLRKITVSLVVLVFSMGMLAACEEKGTLEKAGEKADQAIEETQENMGEAAEEAAKELEE